MLIGAMNHPMREVAGEIWSMRERAFDFVDLTLEPTQAHPGAIDISAVSKALTETGLQAVGHTAWYLPLASPFPSLQQAAFDEFSRCFDVFAKLGIRNVNVHPDQRVALHSPDAVIERNVEALWRLTERAGERQLQLMLENVPGLFNRTDVLRKVFNSVPSLAWHLDVGHANLGSPSNVTESMLEILGDRLIHVHLSDNKGGDADLHLPLGAGTIDWDAIIALLRRHRYDGTITLEVFSPDREYLTLSRQKLRRIWDNSPR